MRLVESFSYDFYSGANVGLWIGGKFITNALGVEFSLIQNKKPIYGYASQLWDGVARGTVQCSGVIIVNFQEPQLLPTLINNILGVKASDLSAVAGSKFRDAQEHLSRNPLVNEPATNPASLTADEKFELRQRLWADGHTHDELISIKPGQLPPRPSPLALLDRPDQHQHPFDVLITYGDAYGNEARQKAGVPIASPSTTRTLRGVELTGFGQTITVEGQPVLEQYPFICREVR